MEENIPPQPPEGHENDEPEVYTDSASQRHVVPRAVPYVDPYQDRPNKSWRFFLWVAILLTLAVIAIISYGSAIFEDFSRQFVVDTGPAVTLPPTPSPSATPTAAAATAVATIEKRSFDLVAPTATPTPVPGGTVLVLKPAAADVGWIASQDAEDAPPNYFGDFFLYTGILDGIIYHSAIQFDLSRIPRGTTIHAASLRLTGLQAKNLGTGGTWQVHILNPEIDHLWRNLNFAQIHNAVPWSTLQPVLRSAMLGVGKLNQFDFTPAQLALLEQRITNSSDEFGPRLSFRLDGPLAGDDNLFTWAGSSNSAEQGFAGPQLFLSLGPPPEEPVPPYYVIATSTPTPENVATAAAISLEMTAVASRVGTATPLPPHWVTPFALTATPTPENQETALAMNQQATAVALTTGQPSPIPPNANVVTTTPTPPFVIATSTPTPENVATAAVISLEMTAIASRLGPATPVPANWVTPLVVTATPTPANAATVEHLQQVALTTGTPTAMPANLQTATPTPVFYPIAPLVEATFTPTPTSTPQTIPPVLLGKILFLSDREGGTSEEPTAYVFDPQTGQLGRLSDMWPYTVVLERDSWSVEERFRVFTKDAVRFDGSAVPALYYYDHLYGVEEQLTKFGAGIAYGGVWSPTSEQIAFVSNESKDDEIWVIDRNGSNLRRLTSTNEAYNAREIGKDTFVPEISKHPSWSPDGQQIVFYSNRTGNHQLWIMAEDGREERLLMEWNPYNDWNPVWVKYLDPAPSP